ncbi:MAG: hypothetical protein ACMUIP_00215 [bacterium]
MINSIKNFYREHKVLFYIGILLCGIGCLSWMLGFNKKIITGSLLLYGLITQMLNALMVYIISLIGMIPWAGPILVKVIMWPVFILINAVIYLTNLWKIKKDKPNKFNAEVGATVLSIGILIGYILAKIF